MGQLAHKDILDRIYKLHNEAASYADKHEVASVKEMNLEPLKNLRLAYEIQRRACLAALDMIQEIQGEPRASNT